MPIEPSLPTMVPLFLGRRLYYALCLLSSYPMAIDFFADNRTSLDLLLRALEARPDFLDWAVYDFSGRLYSRFDRTLRENTHE